MASIIYEAVAWGPAMVCVWDTRVNLDGTLRGRVAQLPFPGMSSVVALGFSADGARLTVVTGDVDHTVHVLDWEKAGGSHASPHASPRASPAFIESTAALRWA